MPFQITHVCPKFCEPSTASADFVNNRAGSIPKFYGSGSEFQATFGSGSYRFHLKLNFRSRFYTVRFFGSGGSNILAKKCPNFFQIEYLVQIFLKMYTFILLIFDNIIEKHALLQISIISY